MAAMFIDPELDNTGKTYVRLRFNAESVCALPPASAQNYAFISRYRGKI